MQVAGKVRKPPRKRRTTKASLRVARLGVRSPTAY